MKIIDISWPLSENTTAYKNKKIITFTQSKTFEKDKARETLITFGSHSGTHIDAPSHFLQNGPAIEQIGLERLCGPCRVIDVSNLENCITQKDLEKIIIATDEIILFKTRNSQLNPYDAFNPQFIYLEKSGAAYLAEKKIKAVGIDYLGIERNQPLHETHVILLKNNITIIEGLRLKDVVAGNYTLICLPLALQGIDGAPARAILIQD